MAGSVYLATGEHRVASRGGTDGSVVQTGRSGLSRFDESFYLQQGGRERSRHFSPGGALIDYVWAGSREGLSPSAAFDEGYYRASNPDVAAAIDAADFVCGYHHYLRSGEAEGRRGLPPAKTCVLDAGRLEPASGPALARLATEVQRARPHWRVVVAAGWKLPAGPLLHPWVGWAEVSPKPEKRAGGIAAERPDYLLCLGVPVSPPPERAAAVAVTDGPAPGDAGLDLVDMVIRVAGSVAQEIAKPAMSGERIAAALEAAEQARAGRRGSRIVGGDGTGAIGTGLAIVLPQADAPRVVTVAVDLPRGLGKSSEALVLEAGGETADMVAAPGRPAHTVVRVGAAPARIALRPRKSGYRAASRLALARVEVAPVDLVTGPTGEGAAADELAVIDLNADLARAKRELGRFMTKADAMIGARPALEFAMPSVPRLAPLDIPRCLLVSTFDADRSWAGRDTLDVAAWRDYLGNRGFAVDLLELPLETAADAGRLRKRDRSGQRFVVMTGPRSPALLREAAEWSTGVVRLYRGAISGGRAAEPHRRDDDVACARLADRLIVGCAAEAAVYRSAGVPPGRIDYVPEFLPPPFRRPQRPYEGRPRRLMPYLDTRAVLAGGLRTHRLLGGAVPALARDAWQVVVCAAPRLRSRIEAELGLSAAPAVVDWCDPAVDLPVALHATRTVLAPLLDRSEAGGLVTVARILGIRLLLDDPGSGPHGRHLGRIPARAEAIAALDAQDAPPADDMEAVRAEAFRALDRVFGFRGAGWQEGRGDRSADI